MVKVVQKGYSQKVVAEDLRSRSHEPHCKERE